MYICHKCIDDPELNSWIKDIGNKKQCTFCKRKLKCIPINILYDRIEEVYKDLYTLCDTYPYFSDEFDNPLRKQEGDSPVTIISDILSCDIEIAEFIVDKLWEREKYSVYKNGEMPYFDKGEKYIQVDCYPYYLHEIWLAFQNRIRFKKRFFDEEAKELLHNLLFDIEPFSQSLKEQSPLFYLSPNSDEVKIYRARLADSWEKVKTILNDPANQLGPPPLHIAKSGRMNPQGIPVFYGALNQETCIAEVRPPIGSFVVIGEFEYTCMLKILDLTIFSNFPKYDSVFSNDFKENMEKWRFLHDFQLMIAKPVVPKDEPIEYVATQAVAEYLKEFYDIDGIIYNSSQIHDNKNSHEESQKNIVIFNETIFSDSTLKSTLSMVNSNLHPCLKLKNESVAIYKIESVQYFYTNISPYNDPFNENDSEVF